MMKKILFLLSVLFASGVYSQETFTWNSEGLSPAYIVSEFPDKDKDELYKKTLSFIKETYRNPDKVIQTTIEGELIRINALKTNLICFRGLGMTNCEDGHYTISFEFKDGKVKIEPMELYYFSSSKYVSGRQDISLTDGSEMFKGNGKLRSVFREVPPAIENTFNSVLASHRLYVNDSHPAKQDSDW